MTEPSNAFTDLLSVRPDGRGGVRVGHTHVLADQIDSFCAYVRAVADKQVERMAAFLAETADLAPEDAARALFEEFTVAELGA